MDTPSNLPLKVIDLDSSFFWGVGRDMTDGERKEAEAHGRFDNPPMSVLGITDGLAAVEGQALATLFSAAPELLEALQVAFDVGGFSSRPVTRDIGRCERCGGTTPSGMLKVCRKCAAQQIIAAIQKATFLPGR